MNVKILRGDNSDSAVARNVSNLMLNNYKKGIAISNNELAQENGIASSVGVVDPTQTIRIGKQENIPVSGPDVSKGYKIKPINATDVTKVGINANAQQAKEFILQSKALDNELDHVIAHMKLNNKDEFYDQGRTGVMNPKQHKMVVRDTKATADKDPQIMALEHKIKNRHIALHMIKKEYNKSTINDEQVQDEVDAYITELENEIEGLDAEMRQLRGKYKAPPQDTIVDSLVDQGLTVNRSRGKNKTDLNTFQPMTYDEYGDTTSGDSSHLKSKNGVRIVSATDVQNFSQDLLLAIKKIVNHITSVLLPLAQKMFDSRFQGITLQDKNVVIPELYQDMDQKMYILTSLNNQSNTQLIKLDKDFDKVYSLVKNGLDMYVMPTGGSMKGGSVSKRYVIPDTDYRYEL